MPIRSYRDLVVWQKSIDLVEATYDLVRSLPVTEQHGLAGQMRRASVSIAANIAEGYGRGSTRDYGRFLRMAFASRLELETLALICVRLRLLDQRKAEELLGASEEVGRMLAGLMRSLKQSSGARH